MLGVRSCATAIRLKLLKPAESWRRLDWSAMAIALKKRRTSGQSQASEVPVTVASLSEAHGCANGALCGAVEVTIVHCSELRSNKVADCVVADGGALKIS